MNKIPRIRKGPLVVIGICVLISLGMFVYYLVRYLILLNSN